MIQYPIRAVRKDILYYIPAQVIPALVGFFAVAAYTRLLSPEEYGQYILIITTISIISSVVFSWLNQSGLRYFEEYKRKDLLTQFVSTAFLSLFTLLIVISLGWYFVTIVFNEFWDSNLVQIVVLVLISNVSYLFTLVLLRAERKSFIYGLYTSLNSLATFFLAIALIKFLNFGPAGILWAIIFSQGTIFLLEMARLYKHVKIKMSDYSIKLLRRFVSYGIPMVGFSIGVRILAVLDRYVIKYFIGTEAVGIYSASYVLAQRSVDALSGILMLAALPILFQTFEHQGEQKTNILLKRLTGIYLVILIPVVAGITVLSRDIINVVLDHSFRETYVILPWVAGGIFFFGLAQYASAAFKLKEKTPFLLYTIILAATVNVVLNFFLIPKLGILGAAYATLVAYLIYFVILWITGCKLLHLKFPWQALWKAVLASFGMTMFLKTVPLNLSSSVVTLLNKVILGTSIYFISLMVLKEKNFIDGLKFLISSAKSLKRSRFVVKDQ